MTGPKETTLAALREAEAAGLTRKEAIERTGFSRPTVLKGGGCSMTIECIATYLIGVVTGLALFLVVAIAWSELRRVHRRTPQP